MLNEMGREDPLDGEEWTDEEGEGGDVMRKEEERNRKNLIP